MAILHRPALLIADEATSALDVITQSEILELFRGLNRETGMSILYISHDLPSGRRNLPAIAIRHEGEIVESGRWNRFLQRPPRDTAADAALPQLPVQRKCFWPGRSTPSRWTN